MEPKRINIALQGGGAHGAFSWGVLERLLDEPKIEIAAISGTSAGALNGAALAAGLGKGPGGFGRRAARDNLAHVWAEVGRVSDSVMLRWLYSMFPASASFRRFADMFSPVAWVETMARIISPYDSGPFYSNPLANVLNSMPHGLENAQKGPEFFVSATNVRSGQIRVFAREEVTVDAVMASACLPELFRAVEIHDPRTGQLEAYWDGGYSANPALFPLYAPHLPRDIVIVNINPMLREALPKSPSAIQDRVNEISFNASFLGELRAISFVKRLFAEDRLEGLPMKNVLVHLIRDEELMNSLSSRTKILPDPGLLERMRQAGHEAAERFMVDSFGHIGTRDSFDLATLFRPRPA